MAHIHFANEVHQFVDKNFSALNYAKSKSEISKFLKQIWENKENLNQILYAKALLPCFEP